MSRAHYWTSEHENKLVELYSDYGTHTAVAREMTRYFGISFRRKQVASKYKRLSTVAPHEVVETVPEHIVKPEDMKPHMCCYPFGDPKKDGFGYCGKDKLSGYSYCAEHKSICYTDGKKYVERNWIKNEPY